MLINICISLHSEKIGPCPKRLVISMACNLDGPRTTTGGRDKPGKVSVMQHDSFSAACQSKLLLLIIVYSVLISSTYSRVSPIMFSVWLAP